MKSSQPKLQIPEFIPSSSSQDLVWSPTTGSRPRRPSDDPVDTDSEASTAKHTLTPTLAAETPHSSSSKQPPHSPSTPASNVSPLSPSPGPTPGSPAHGTVIRSPVRTWPQATPLADITNRQQHNSPFPSSPRQFADRAHHHPLMHHASPKTYPQHMKDPQPFSSNYQQLPPPSQDFPPSLAAIFSNQPPPPHTHQSPRSGLPTTPAPRTSPGYSLPPRVSQQPQAQLDPAFINQLNTLALPRTRDQGGPPQLPPQAPYPIFTQHYPPPQQLQPQHQDQRTQFPPNQNPELLQIPPPGSMDPLSYWNLLYHRENSILSRLAAAGLHLTDAQAQYIARLQQARVSAAASQLPYRGHKGKAGWLKQLEEVLDGIWVMKPGQTGFPEEVVARKRDFERAVCEEIEMARMEPRKGR